MSGAEAQGAGWWRTTAYAAGAAGGIASAGLAVGAFGLHMLTAARPGQETRPSTIVGVDATGGSPSVTLVGHNADLPGIVGLAGPSGRLLAGAPHARGHGWQRDVWAVEGTPGLLVEPGQGVFVTPDPWFDLADPFGWQPNHDQFDTVDGPLAVTRAGPGDAGRAVVFVHGRAGQRHTGWWVAPTAAEAGWATVMPAYRNDADGAARTGRYLLGGEWVDLASVLGRLGRDGISEVVLVGWSMGGNICASYLRERQRNRSAFVGHPRVAGLVLDAAALDWGLVLRQLARARRIPRQAAPLVMTWGQMAARIDWRDLNHLADPSHLDLPVLAIHGVDDQVVPVEVTESLAAALPDARPVLFDDGGHCRSVNVAPGRYLTELRRFLDAL